VGTRDGADGAELVTIDLRCGRWQDALADVEMVDAVITDPPYSDRTHVGMRTGAALTGSGNPYDRAGVVYEKWSAADVRAFVASWAPRCRGWFVAVTDHVLARDFEAALEAADRYVFQPLPFLEMGKQPRLTGDGPASWACWIVVARPKSREMQRWGSLPGGYVPPAGLGIQSDREIKGGKPTWLMRELVRDYTRPGDLVCDPCAGGATTLLAAAIEGRRAIGAEMDPETYAKAQKRIARGYTPTMFADPVPEMKQEPLL
jgi:site-specific DNA-methyltransferase (adenine-specific)